MRHVVQARDAHDFAEKLLHLVYAGSGDDPVLHAVVDAGDED
jgi:hypothetical protein